MHDKTACSSREQVKFYKNVVDFKFKTVHKAFRMLLLGDPLHDVLRLSPRAKGFGKQILMAGKIKATISDFKT